MLFARCVRSPGNHDVPLYNVFDRFLRKLDKFEKYITDDLTPTFIDEEIAIVGVNTARSLTIKGGRISEEQTHYIQSQLRNLSDDMLKVVVTAFEIAASSLGMIAIFSRPPCTPRPELMVTVLRAPVMR